MGALVVLIALVVVIVLFFSPPGQDSGMKVETVKKKEEREKRNFCYGSNFCQNCNIGRIKLYTVPIGDHKGKRCCAYCLDKLNPPPYKPNLNRLFNPHAGQKQWDPEGNKKIKDQSDIKITHEVEIEEEQPMDLDEMLEHFGDPKEKAYRRNWFRW